MRWIREIDNELDTKKEMLERIKLVLLEDDVDDFIHEYAKDILVYKKPIEDLLEKANKNRLTLLSISPYITKLHEIPEHIETLIDNTSNNYMLSYDFDDFIKDNKIEIEEYKEWYKIVYKIILDLIPKTETPNIMFEMNIPSMMPQLQNPSLFRMTSPIIARDRIKERNNLQDEIQILSGFKEEQMKILLS